MTTTITIRSILSASAISALGAIALFAQTGTASAAKNVLSCNGSSRHKVVDCCEQLVRKNGLPMWMKQQATNCRTGVRCVGQATGIKAAVSANYCYYVKEQIADGKGTPHRGQRGGKY